MTILLTGAGGKTGQAVLEALLPQARSIGMPVRLFLRRQRKLPEGVEAVTGDMTRAGDWQEAMAGIERVYHICPNMHADEQRIGRLALDSARQAGVRHFVYHSVLHPQTEKMPHHWHKLRVEEMLLESGLPFTILQPAAYIQNIRAGWDQIRDTGTYTVPYPAETRISLVDLKDVGQIAAKVLLSDRHFGATYQLVGTRALTQTEVAGQLTEVVGRPVQVREISLEQWHHQVQQAGLSDYAIGTLLAMFRYYADFGLGGNPAVLRFLLGREPAGVAECARRWQPGHVPA